MLDILRSTLAMAEHAEQEKDSCLECFRNMAVLHWEWTLYPLAEGLIHFHRMQREWLVQLALLKLEL